MERGQISALDFLPEGVSVPNLAASPRPRNVSAAARRVRVAVVCFASVMAMILFFQNTAGTHTASAGSVPRATASPEPSRPTTSARAPLTPREVALAYLAAISRHDWPEVWRLGGDNVGHGQYATYAGMVAGYAGTVKDVPLPLKVAGRTVSGHFLAYESDGEIRTYAFTYVIRNGVIVHATADEVKSARQT